MGNRFIYYSIALDRLNGMIIYLPISILLALVDCLRMKRVWGIRHNINHWLSYGLAVVSAACIYLWKPEPWYLFIPGCVAARWLVFDPFLNIFVNFIIIPRAINYVSKTTNAITEKVKISFWAERAIAAAVLIIILLINHFI